MTEDEKLERTIKAKELGWTRVGYNTYRKETKDTPLYRKWEEIKK